MMKIKVMLQVENPRLNEEINIASIRQKLKFHEIMSPTTLNQPKCYYMILN